MLTGLWLLPLVTAVLTIEDTSTTLRFREIHSYRNEFGCLPANWSGTVTVLEFTLILCNEGTSLVRLEDDRTVSAVLLDEYGSVVENSATSLVLPGLRDSICPQNLENTQGARFKLSPGCCCVLSAGIPCIWIVVSNLTLPDPFLLRLTFGNSTSLTDPMSIQALQEMQMIQEHEVTNFSFLLLIGGVVTMLVPYVRAKRLGLITKRTQ